MYFIYNYSHIQYSFCNQLVLFAQLENLNKLNRSVHVNEVKTKAKLSQITLKLATRSIVRFRPQTMQWYH